MNIYYDMDILTEENITKLHQLRDHAATEIDKLGMNHQILEATIRYDMLDRALKEDNIITREDVEYVSRSEKADRVLTHAWMGPVIFITLLYVIFQSIFTFASIPMNYIAVGVGMFGDYIIKIMPLGILRDLLVEGVISGVGSILIFLPQILILMFFSIVIDGASP